MSVLIDPVIDSLNKTSRKYNWQYIASTTFCFVVVLLTSANLGWAVGYRGVGVNTGVIAGVALGSTLFFLILMKKVRRQVGTATVGAVVVFLLWFGVATGVPSVFQLGIIGAVIGWVAGYLPCKVCWIISSILTPFAMTVSLPVSTQSPVFRYIEIVLNPIPPPLNEFIFLGCCITIGWVCATISASTANKPQQRC